ncbi:MAG: hypothetical protein ACREXT_06515, partial [Gammaproteobacteria bacterium]
DPSAAEWQRQFGYFGQIALVVFAVGGATVSIEMWDGYLILIALTAAVSRIRPNPTLSESKRADWREMLRGRVRSGHAKRQDRQHYL